MHCVLLLPHQPNMIITPWNERKSEESAGSGHAARGAEMDEASGAGAPVRRFECSLLLKDIEIIVDGFECVRCLSQGSSYLERILRHEGVQSCLLEGGGKIYFFVRLFVQCAHRAWEQNAQAK